jgi:hypothetical protein
MFTRLSQIQKLRPTFDFGQMEMVEWFEVTTTSHFCSIRSGLRHADGVTKSPYHYEHAEIGPGANKRSLAHFNNFWKEFTNEIEFHVTSKKNIK